MLILEATFTGSFDLECVRRRSVSHCFPALVGIILSDHNIKSQGHGDVSEATAILAQLLQYELMRTRLSCFLFWQSASPALNYQPTSSRSQHKVLGGYALPLGTSTILPHVATTRLTPELACKWQMQPVKASKRCYFEQWIQM